MVGLFSAVISGLLREIFVHTRILVAVSMISSLLHSYGLLGNLASCTSFSSSYGSTRCLSGHTNLSPSAERLDLRSCLLPSQYTRYSLPSRSQDQY
ncbi:hypothetical protein GGS24DRAFT_457685 [Hypoxylon argillaceum]|nr:hypothetical protein GGS24DRAFT_457685 [Hypoxylon argillaceum]